MAEPEYQPRVLLETKTYRVTVKPCPPFEGSPRRDEVTIEKRAESAMGEKYWGPVHHFWSGSRTTQDQSTMYELFEEMANTKPPENKLHDKLAFLLIEASGRATSEVTLLPDVPFDGREGNVGIRLTPAMLVELNKLFPGTADSGDLLAKLLERAAQELLL